MSRITILIVDDHTLIRETWSFLLSGLEEEFEVIGSVDAPKAIDLARDKRPNIVLLDINMAPLNGFDLLQMINKSTPSSKVIAVSMHTQPSYAKKMLRLGARGYVTKNSSRKEMVTAIKEVMAGNIYICKEIKDIFSAQMLSDDEAPGLNQLSERQIEIIHLIKDGLSSKEIGIKLNITCKTVEVHRHNIFKKLKKKNIADLINFINASDL